MINAVKQQDILLGIARKLKRRIESYAIGGTAMIFYGLKDTTKDIDLVFLNEKDKEEFKQAALDFGFSEMNAVRVYGLKINRPNMLVFEDVRLDLFVRKVVDFEY